MPGRAGGLAFTLLLVLELMIATTVEGLDQYVTIIYVNGDIIVENTKIDQSITYVVSDAKVVGIHNVTVGGDMTIFMESGFANSTVLEDVRGDNVELYINTSRVEISDTYVERLVLYITWPNSVEISCNNSYIREFLVTTRGGVSAKNIKSETLIVEAAMNVLIDGSSVGNLKVLGLNSPIVIVSNSNLTYLQVGSILSPVNSVVLNESHIGMRGSINSSSQQGLVAVTAAGSVQVLESVLIVDHAYIHASVIRLENSTVSSGQLLAVASSLEVSGSRISIVSARSVVNKTLSFDKTTLNLQEPWIIFLSEKASGLTVNSSTFMCPRGCLTVVLADANVSASLTWSLFYGSPAVTVTSYPPKSGRITIFVDKCYFQHPVGPTIIVGGTLLRRGGSTVAVSGSAVGSVLLRSWLATPSGPIITPVGSPRVEARVEPNVRVEYGVVEGEKDWVVVIAYSNIPTDMWNVSVSEYKVVGALSPAGWGSVREDSVYIVQTPRPVNALLVFLERVEESIPRPENYTVTSSRDTSESGVETTTPPEWGVPKIVAVSLLTAGIVVGYLYVRRGRS